MKLRSIIDDKKKQKVRDAIAKGDASIFGTKKKIVAPPLVEPTTGVDWSKLDLSKVNSDRGIPIQWKLSALSAVETANNHDKVIIPNIGHERILDSPNIHNLQNPRYPVWTGTMAVYESYGEPFKDKVVFTYEDTDKKSYTVIFTVPGRFIGKVNSALVIEHPDFGIETLGNGIYRVKVKDDNAVNSLDNFPSREEDYWYDNFDAKFGIPVAGLSGIEGRRKLGLLSCPYVGLISRDNSDGIKRLRVSIDKIPTDLLHVSFISREVYESLKAGGNP